MNRYISCSCTLSDAPKVAGVVAGMKVVVVRCGGGVELSNIISLFKHLSYHDCYLKCAPN